ncbi:Uncharacterized protein NV38_0003571 [Leptospira kirschneri serovar Mozdok]|nr:Uncharacterized protein NV38_0003571 [Leptospira kirschneri serovar Mozdok]
MDLYHTHKIRASKDRSEYFIKNLSGLELLKTELALFKKNFCFIRICPKS